MGTPGTITAGLCLALAVTACSSGSGKVLVQGSQPPPIATSSASASATPTATPSASPSGPADRKKPHPTASSTTATVRPATTASSTPRATATTRPKATPTKTATRTSSGCTTQGPTTTIQMVTGYRFSPSSVTINRCDAVKAVYADTSGAPHNWKGSKWSSPDMSSTGQSYTYRFTSSGTFNFFCSYHQSFGMTGTVTVH